MESVGEKFVARSQDAPSQLLQVCYALPAFDGFRHNPVHPANIR